MIFRGDGKNNIIEGNSFGKKIPKKASKVLMNPPFALKKDDEKEYRFIDNALEQMEDGGLLFAIIPSTVMFKGRQLKNWRERVLEGNTIVAVIKLPEDLFYPVAVHTSAVIIRKGIPHEKSGDVFWGNLIDGYVKKKGVMKPSNGGDLDLMKSAIKDFINGSRSLAKSVPKKYTLAPILFDNDLECAPEYYLNGDRLSEERLIKEMGEVLSTLFTFLMNNSDCVKGQIEVAKKNDKKRLAISDSNDLDALFHIENAKSENIEDYETGKIPFVTSTELNNGVEKFIDAEDNIISESCITLSSFGFAAVQLPPFVARSHGAVILLRPKIKMGLLELAFFAAQINQQKWRFSYGRWVTKKRLLKLEMKPINSAKLPRLEIFTKKFEANFNLAMKKML
jgi:hypothetical protein